jgi:Flp pilus assembly protein TadD
MSKKPVKPAKSVRESFAKPISAAVLAAVIIGAGSYWYLHRPPTIGQHLWQGDEYAKQGANAMAMQEYMAAAAINKSDPAPYLAMSRLEERAGNLGTAADRLGTVLHYHPHYPHIQCHRAELYGVANRFEMAYTVARDAVTVEPNCPTAHNDMGMLLEMTDDIPGAARELGQAHTLAPDDDALTLDYARLLAKSGKADDALNIVDEVLPVTKLFKVQANYLEGWIFAEYGRGGHRDYVKAQSFLGAALAENPMHTQSLAESGKIFLNQRALAAAEVQLEKAHKHGPDTIELLTDLVQLYQKEKNPKLAETASITEQMKSMLVPMRKYRRRWIDHPGDLDNTLTLAKAELTAGNMLDAFDLVKQVLAIDPNHDGAAKLYNDMKNPTTPVQAKAAVTQDSQTSLDSVR